jgi:hypothetical protein
MSVAQEAEEALQSGAEHCRSECGLLPHLVFDRRCGFVPVDAVAQAQEGTLDGDVEQQSRQQTTDRVEQP